MRKKNYTFWLVIVYIVMAAVCAALLIFSRHDLTSIVINTVMFVIVGIIFIFSANRFSIGWKMQKALYSASARIREDARADSRYLWDRYKNEPGAVLFPDNILTRQYQKYTQEMLRLEKYPNADYKCDIEDYINKEYIDVSMSKNILNLVTGTMTGLGILGTFVGLAFGLQFFNTTGTAAEITNSIAPLMDGIKVAFHTSIYGLVFSLVFSFVYKASMEAVYSQLDEFLSLFNTYVAGDPVNDNESNMRQMLQALPETLGASISEQMNQGLTPIVYNMNKTMMDFAQTVADNQAEGIRGMAKEFVDRLNTAMSESFTNFGQVINETCRIQNENNSYAQSIMERMGEVSGNVNDINTLSVQVINSLSGYIDQVEKLQEVITDNYNSTYRQMQLLQEHEERMQGYVHAISSYEKEVNDGIKQQLDEVMSISRVFALEITATSTKLTEMLDSARTDINDAAKELSAASTDLDEKLNSSVRETFNLFDTNMAHVTAQLGETMDRIDQTTEKVPEVVLAAYDGMKQSFDSMQAEMDNLISTLGNADRAN